MFVKTNGLTRLPHRRSENVTPREVEMIERALQGQCRKEIASTLNISTKTVDAHFTNLYRKLGAVTILQAYQTMLENNILQP